jgi:hypothetical protein
MKANDGSLLLEALERDLLLSEAKRLRLSGAEATAQAIEQITERCDSEQRQNLLISLRMARVE